MQPAAFIRYDVQPAATIRYASAADIRYEPEPPMPLIPSKQRAAAANRNAENRPDLDEPGLQSVPDPATARGYSYLGRCAHCRRKILLKNSNHRYCSPACKRAVENILRRRKRAAQREDLMRWCAECNESFRPKRKDAQVCSNRCRQAAHRRWVRFNTPIR